MLTITDIAATTALEVLEEEGKTGWGLRIFTGAESGCCGPSFEMEIVEKPEDGDVTVEKNGLRVFIENNTVKSLEGMFIDFIEDDEGGGFIIRGADDAHSSCGCSSCG